ncbi:Hypothetical_protein [Hexamita inflata]|uniref:Hypothetical_protein n=1 Tax=Hexamita inflata TaxID=28002 RepID=A0AA86R5B8_9EUKA|nr:Hypothetical protein HINF_LOCUS59644 [Hexamita inflata]
MSAAAIYACHRQYREAKTALGKQVPTVHDYQSYFYKQLHRQYHRLGIGISKLFSGYPSQELHKPMVLELFQSANFEFKSNSSTSPRLFPKCENTLQHEFRSQFVIRIWTQHSSCVGMFTD